MNRSESIDLIGAALASAQLELEPAIKDSVNPHFKSDYASLGAIIEASRILAKHGIAVTNETGLECGRFGLTTMLIFKGQWLSSWWPIPETKVQEMGSNTTYARRYNLGALASIATESDDDGNAAQSASETGGVVAAAMAARNQRLAAGREPQDD